MERACTAPYSGYNKYHYNTTTMIYAQLIKYMILSIAMLAAGMLFYGIYNKLIIIRLPVRIKATSLTQRSAHRKQVKLIYWNGDQFVTEEKEIIYSVNTQATLTDLIASWLSLVEEEQILTRKVSVQSVMLNDSKDTLFISFDRNPLTKDQSTYAKLMFFEGLLKTIKESTIPVHKIHFLVHYKPLHDRHLDFSHAWPINGYLTT